MEKLQAEIERMEAEAARITKETEEIEKQKDGAKTAAAAAPGAATSQVKRDGYEHNRGLDCLRTRHFLVSLSNVLYCVFVVSRVVLLTLQLLLCLHQVLSVHRASGLCGNAGRALGAL